MRVVIALVVVIGTLAPSRPAGAATCVDDIGPGIPPPASLPPKLAGFHASWYGQSGYMRLCAGHTATATLAYYNSGSLGWVAGRLGKVAYLGTWASEPGQDQQRILDGDGALGSPSTGWPRFNRIAIQPAPYVGPGQVAWFQFTLRAPANPGTYRLYVRPLIEGATWLEDFGVFWLVTVLNPDGTRPPAPPAVYSPTGFSRIDVPTAVGTFPTWLIKERLSAVRGRTVTANTSDCFSACPAKPLAQYVAENGAYAGIHGSYFCPPDYAPCASKVNTYDYAVYNSNLGAWINPRHLSNPMNALATFGTGTATFYRRVFSYARGPVSAGISNFPLVLQNGVPVDVSADIDSNQMLHGTRGVIAADSTYIY